MGLQSLGYDVAAAGTNQWNGVAIISRVGLDDVEVGFPDMPGWGDPAESESRAIGATCGGVRIWSLYVPNGRKPDDPHYVYKLDWLARLRDAARDWLGGPTALVGDWNIAPQDDDVFDMAAYAKSTHVTPPERAAFQRIPRRRVRRRRPPAHTGARRLHVLGLLPAALRAEPRDADRLRARHRPPWPTASPARSSTATSAPAPAHPTTPRSSWTSTDQPRQRRGEWSQQLDQRRADVGPAPRAAQSRHRSSGRAVRSTGSASAWRWRPSRCSCCTGSQAALDRDLAVYAYGGQQVVEGVPPYVSILESRRTARPPGPARRSAGSHDLVGIDDLLGMRLLMMLRLGRPGVWARLPRGAGHASGRDCAGVASRRRPC